MRAEPTVEIIVGRLRRLVPQGTPLEASFPSSRWRPGVWVRALRLEHWVKNTLVFVAPVLGLQIAAPMVLGQSILLFLLMGLLASATYLVNDAVDLEADRQHPRKRLRPMAAGMITICNGLTVAAGLIVFSLTLSLVLPLACTVTLLVYLAVTLAYSFVLKRKPIVDVFVLAGLFTVRIVAGGWLISGLISPWLLTFSMMFFLGLAVVKRYAELERVVRTGGEGVTSRGYTSNDLPLLLATGVGSGLGAVVIFTMYLINDHYPRAIYKSPEALWVMMPVLLLWTLRTWHITVHGRMNEDPVVFALKDRASLFLGAFIIMTLITAWL
jgi:4-hydroxybenzoate polyprenyltransferase